MRARISSGESATRKPSSDLIIVLLPAPFGPSSPTAPDGNAALTSRSAACRPYATVTLSSVTVGAAVAGPVSTIHLDIRRGPGNGFTTNPATRDRPLSRA